MGPGIQTEDKILAGWSGIMKVLMTLTKHLCVGLIHRFPVQSLGTRELQRGAVYRSGIRAPMIKETQED